MPQKRKMAQAASALSDVEDKSAKRRKLPIKIQAIEAEGDTEGTTKHGLEFLELIKEAKDKRGRPIATNFLTLPDKKQLSDYYETIVMPLALDTIEGKLTRREYPNLTTLESDLKRLVANAKSYNERTSELFADAERIRKMVSHYMMKHNPAYKDPAYAAFPTPLPDATSHLPDQMPKLHITSIKILGPGKPDETDMNGTSDVDTGGGTGGARSGARSTRRTSSTLKTITIKPLADKPQARIPVIDSSNLEGFEGKTFQAAQEQIVTEMIQLRDDAGQGISWPFLNLPTRKLTDYYHLIKTPESLKRIEKKVRGVQGRDDPTGISMFKSWSHYEDHVSLIWRNAHQYNEDGSEISSLADTLEKFFRSRLMEAKKSVSEPAQPSLKLKMAAAKSLDIPPQKIMLRLGGGASTSTFKSQSPAPATAEASSKSGIDVSDRNSQRERQDTEAGADETKRSSAAGATTSSGTDPIALAAGSTSTPMAVAVVGSIAHSAASHEESHSSAAVSSSVPDGVAAVRPTLRGSSGTELPHKNGIHIPTNTSHLSMPPIAAGNVAGLLNGNHPPSSGPAASLSLPQVPISSAVTAFDSKWRLPGKSASDALISSLSVSTHPMLRIGRPFRLEVPPSDTLSQQSVTVNLPSTHTYLRIIPTMSSSTSNRQRKIFITASGQRLNPLPPIPNHSDPNKPMYDVRLNAGVNRVEVEMIAGPLRGTPKVGSGPDIDLEKISLFVNLLRP